MRTAYAQRGRTRHHEIRNWRAVSVGHTEGLGHQVRIQFSIAGQCAAQTTNDVARTVQNTAYLLFNEGITLFCNQHRFALVHHFSDEFGR